MDLDLADLDDIAALMGHEAGASDPGCVLDPGDLVSVGVNWEVQTSDEFGDARLSPAERSPPTWSAW